MTILASCYLVSCYHQTLSNKATSIDLSRTKLTGDKSKYSSTSKFEDVFVEFVAYRISSFDMVVKWRHDTV
jgi:hypothetical protein